MSNILIPIEILAGAYITDTLAEAKKLAIRLDCTIIFTINGIDYQIDQGTDINKINKKRTTPQGEPIISL